MFVVDSSVWVEFYAERWGREASMLREGIREAGQVSLCGPILQEVLQGFRDEAVFQREWRLLLNFTVFEATRWTLLRAASLYRQLRKKGVTVNSFDTAIAAVCLEQGVPLLTCDRRDFGPIARYAGLRLL